MAITCIKLKKDRDGHLNLKYETSYIDREQTNIKIALYLCGENFEPIDADSPSLLFKEMTEEEYHKILRSSYKGYIDEKLSSNPEWNV